VPSPGTIYSVKLYAAQGTTGSGPIVVPAGYVIVLRDCDVYSDNVLPGNFFLHGSAGQTIWYHGFDLDAGRAYASWRGRQVVVAGDTFDVSCDITVDVTLSGYRLTAP
jgi:hypothetical protein